MKPINTIIVDDEYEAREGIKLLLEDDLDIHILGLCKNGIEAIDMVNEHEIDLVFLDIQMPVVNGFEVVNSLPKEKLPHIIFVTAYDQYAIKAFEIHAVDYILKPFTDARFAEGLTRAKQLIYQQKTQEEQIKLMSIAHQFAQKSSLSDQAFMTSSKEIDRLVVKEKGKVMLIPLSDIIWFEAYDYYVKIHLSHQFYMIRESMKKLESRLPDSHFLRVHKSSIVNLQFIQSYRSSTSSDLILTLKNNQQINVSRSYKEAVKKLFH